MINIPGKRPTSFGGSALNTCAAIESNILLNKGITDIGGFVIPQAIMSNNKDEAIERVFKSALYFVFTFVSPFLLLPLINKHFLKSSKIVEIFSDDQKRILEVSKKYLTKDGEYLKEGIKKAAKKFFNNENKFDETLSKYTDLEKLRKDLINVHTKIHAMDFLTTNLLVASTPWIGNAFTKYRTNRSGYSGTYKLADEDFTKKSAEKHDKTKSLRQAATLAIALLPAVTLPFLVKKGMLNNSENKILKWFNKNAEKFDYKDAIFMSRLTGLTMWLASDYFPYQLASRDKYEYRDCLIRGTSIGLVFWGGDLFLKKTFSKLSDKFFKTKLTNPETKEPYRLSDLKHKCDSLEKVSKKTLERTRSAGVILYVLNLILISATLGFGIPKMLNKLLKNSVNKDNVKPSLNFDFIHKPEVFEDFYAKKGEKIL
mgnify:CR=1 FL=1